MRHSVTLLVSLAVTLTAYAEPTSKQAALGSQLAELLDYSALYTTFENDCRSPKRTLFDPKKLFEANPQAFGGMTPESSYWPRVEAAYDRYRAAVCSALAPNDIDDFVGLQLASQLSEKDLAAAISFYSSPEGRKFQRANAHANEAVRRRAERLLGGFSSPAYKELSSALTEIVQEYRRAPK